MTLGTTFRGTYSEKFDPTFDVVVLAPVAFSARLWSRDLRSFATAALRVATNQPSTAIPPPAAEVL